MEGPSRLSGETVATSRCSILASQRLENDDHSEDYCDCERLAFAIESLLMKYIFTASDNKDKLWTILLFIQSHFDELQGRRKENEKSPTGFLHGSYQVNMLNLIRIFIREVFYGWKSLTPTLEAC